MATDHPESQETTSKEMTIAASLPFQHRFISQTQDEQLQQGEAEHGAGRIHPLFPSPPFHLPSALGLPWVSHLILLQGCVKTAVKWKPWDIASKRLEIIFELCLPSSLPSWNGCVLSCRKQEMLGGAVKLCARTNLRLWEEKGEQVCVWEGKAVAVLIRTESPMSVPMSWGQGVEAVAAAVTQTHTGVFSWGGQTWFTRYTISTKPTSPNSHHAGGASLTEF